MHSNRERKSETNWKIFHAANRRLSDKYTCIRKIKSFPTYEEYAEIISDEKISTRANISCDLLEHEDEIGLENLFSLEYSKREKIKEEKEKQPHKTSYDSLQPELRDDENSSISRSSCSEHVGSNSSNQSESDSWESASESSDDQTVDEYLKNVAAGNSGIDHQGDKPFNPEKLCLPYASLKACVLRDFMNRDHLKDHTHTDDKEVLKANKYLDENLPLMQVLDVIEDIDKVLKVGKLTPRMERIMEYKQNHPFAIGYQEEELGCCPWLVFKIERFLNKFWSTQWPN